MLIYVIETESLGLEHFKKMSNHGWSRFKSGIIHQNIIYCLQEEVSTEEGDKHYSLKKIEGRSIMEE